MGILSGLFRTRDGPKNATSGSAYSFFMGTSAAGKSVNERSAIQMTEVYACVRILSESIAGLPLHMYRYEDDGSKTKTVERDTKGRLYYEYQTMKEEAPTMKGAVYQLDPMKSCMYRGLALTALWVTAPSPWQRTPSALQSQPRNMAVSSTPMAPPPAVCWSIPTSSKTLQR